MADDALDDLLDGLDLGDDTSGYTGGDVGGSGGGDDLDGLLDDLMADDTPPVQQPQARGGGRVVQAGGPRPGVSSGPGRGGISSGPGMRTGISSGPGRAGISSGPGRAGISSGPGRPGVSSGPGASRNVISSGPGANWRAKGTTGRGRAMAKYTPDGREIKYTGPDCSNCGEMVIGKVLNVNGKPHHKECFACCECLKPLGGQRFVEKEDQLYCADDYFQVFAPRCYNCQGIIKDKCISTGMEDQRRTYHPQHFICSGCGTSLTKGKIQYKLDLDADPYCVKCFGERLLFIDAEEHTCSMCKKPIIGEYIRLRGQYIHPEHYQCEICHKQFHGGDCREYEGKMYCHEDYLRMLKKTCAACRKPIVGRSMSALNRVWHPEHFVCAHCHEPFGESNFWEKEGQPYCETHYYSLFGDTCAKCLQAVVVDGIVALGKVWHRSHFLCQGCEEPMGAKMWAWEDKPYCRKCFNKLPASIKKNVKQRKVGEQKAAKRRAKMDVKAAKAAQ